MRAFSSQNNLSICINLAVTKVSLKTIEQYFLLVIVIVISDTTYWDYVWSDVDRKPLIILVILVILIAIHKIRIDSKLIVYSVVNIILYGVSAYLNSGGFFNDGAVDGCLTVLTSVWLVIVIYSLDSEYVLIRYVKIVAFLSVISLLFYIPQQIVGLSYFERLFTVDTGRVRGFFLYVASPNDLERNYGIFGEPGVHQMALNTAVFIIVFCAEKLHFKRKKQKKIRNITLILLLTLITTKSTLGIVVTALIFVGVIFSGSGSKRKHLFLIVLLTLFVFVLDYIFNGSSSMLGEHLIKKIADMDIGVGGSFNENTSGGARLFIISVATQTMKTNPLFGVGSIIYSRYLARSYAWKTRGTGNALFITIIKRGLIPVVATIVPIMYTAQKNMKNNMHFIIYITMFILTAVAQSQIMYAPFVLLALNSPNNRLNEDWLRKG